MVTARDAERGVALVFALAALTLVGLTIAAVATEISSRGAGVVLEERSVRTTALSDWAMAETMAALADKGPSFRGLSQRPVVGGTISSTVRRVGEWEVEVVAVGVREDWQSTIVARVSLLTGPRVVWWQRTQGPADAPAMER
jgi:lambda repressor-like predicted transcriptional regulator